MTGPHVFELNGDLTPTDELVYVHDHARAPSRPSKAGANRSQRLLQDLRPRPVPEDVPVEGATRQGSEAGIVGFSGCLASEISQLLMRDDEAGAIKSVTEHRIPE